MAIQHGIWKIGDKPEKLDSVVIASEELLEEQIFQDISILNRDWMLIGRQVHTRSGKYIDLLAVDISGAIIIIELKKNKTPRDVVAQTIDYASWVETLTTDQIMEIYQKFAEKHQLPDKNFGDSFFRVFRRKPEEAELNSSHQMVVVTAELDASTERIIHYLNDSAKVAINAVFFTVFEDGDHQYLSRTWMIDPRETEEHAINIGSKEDWNGEFYASFGANEGGRSWDDARHYQFISAGDGHWYSKTLFNLDVGHRVWVNIPKVGYVGVAEVVAPACIADEFITDDMQLKGVYSRAADVGEDNAEYFVSVKWLKAVSNADAISEVGLFGNQNSVAQPRTSKWPYTVDRLKRIWQIS